MNTESSKVGYKRPPREHQFKKGQKPPPRKPKNTDVEDSVSMFWRVLQEPRRVRLHGKECWRGTTELLVRRAFLEAEKGSSTLQRFLNENMLSDAPVPEQPYELIVEDLDGSQIYPQY